ncbi:TPA: FtsW/RodA/SpoVE family cell cycle protein, partial [Streptococcus suis]
MKIDKRHLLNYSILLPYLILSVIGLIIVYSTTSALQIQKGGNPFSMVISQGLFWILSLVAMFIIYRMKLTVLKKRGLIRFFLLLEVAMLVASHFFDPVNGAHGWIRLGPGGIIGLQPAEYLKLLIVWYLAARFSAMQRDIQVYDYQALIKGSWMPKAFNDWRIVSLFFLGLVASLPDLGNATIVVLI